jgi:hypothetical protein
MANANLRSSFKQTQQYMKQLVDQERLMTTTVKCQVAAVGTKPSGTKGKQPKKGRPTKPVRASDPLTKHLPKAEYDKLTKEQKLALKEARERANRRNSSDVASIGTDAAAPTASTISAVSFSSPTIHNFNPEEAPAQTPLDTKMVFETTVPDKLPATLLNKLQDTTVSPQPTYSNRSCMRVSAH